MAIVRDSGSSSIRVQPRTSTPGTTTMPRWDEEQLDVDLTQFFQPGKWEQPSETQPRSMNLTLDSVPSMNLGSGLTLGLGGLTQAKSNEWSAYAPTPTYTPGRFDQQGMTQAVQQVRSGGGGGYGLSAYGFSGRTGLPQYKGKSPYGFQSQMWNALSSVNQAMQAAGLGRLRITDGFRSYNAQVDVKRRKGDLAATPGRSIHGLGMAADLNLSAKQFQWLKKNGAKYGLINLPSERWHWQLAPSVWNGQFDRRA